LQTVGATLPQNSFKSHKNDPQIAQITQIEAKKWVFWISRGLA
jgi:hypothetical protein